MSFNFCGLIFVFLLVPGVIRIKSTKTIFPRINMADKKAINAIKAHASCHHERALYKNR